MSQLLWKENWAQVQENYTKWWNREGMIIGAWGTGIEMSQMVHSAEKPDAPETHCQRHTDPDWVAANQRYRLGKEMCPADMLPIAFSDYGTVTLATFLGSEPDFQETNIWYEHSDISPDNDYELSFDENHKYWKNLEAVVRRNIEVAGDDYIVGFPGVFPNIDVLAELRGTGNLLMDLITDPEWVHRKLSEINKVYFEVYDKLYDIVKQPDGSSVFSNFMFWGPGRVSLAQCDTAIMISPDMFKEFAVPYLREQCQFVDHTLYHLDGVPALNTLDHLLEIEELDCIEFTPGAGEPQGGKSDWYDVYKSIKKAGKCVQAVWIEPNEVVPLLDEVGPEAMYLMIDFKTPQDVEKVLKDVEQYR